MHRPRDLLSFCALALALALACRAAGPSEEPTPQPPGSASPITDREASRAPADRSVPPGEPGKPRIRDDRGIPIPPNSAAARARTGASNPPPEDDAADEPELVEPASPSPDEGEEEPAVDE